jgi:hypothetical protein
VDINQLKRLIRLLFLFLTLSGFASQAKAADTLNYINFTKAQIFIPKGLTTTEKAAVQMLIDEISKRSSIILPVTMTWPSSPIPVIVVVPASESKNIQSRFLQTMMNTLKDHHAEGYSIKMDTTSSRRPVIFIIGNDQRGVLYGVGYLLRKALIYPNKLLVPKDLNITTHPVVPLRGDQLGSRPGTNSYSGFTISMWESYIRDLIVFGVNSIGLIPPNHNYSSGGPMLPLSPMGMAIKKDKLLQKYDLNAWIWRPMVYGDYSKGKTIKKALANAKKVFSKLPKINAVFVPGGDPGHTPPKVMFNYLKKEAGLLHKYHPKAQLWMSPQGFDSQWMKTFFQLLKKNPKWLDGIVYGPHLRISLEQLRKKVPQRYRIRRYPDIVHSKDCQYPVPNWDFAYAATEGRGAINPRPTQEAAIFRSANSKDYYGFITYSEGVTDDVNMMTWGALGWNPHTKVSDILRDYSRYFIGPKYTYDFAQDLLDLEKNWEGPLLDNSSVDQTLLKFQSMEKRVSPRQRLNWRFQEALYRAYYDAYDRSRLIFETNMENNAMSILRKAPQIGSLLAMKKAEMKLNQAVKNPVSQDWKRRIYTLAEALFQSIHMKKSVNKYFAKRVSRGANLDLIDYPLNNRFWLEHQFSRIAQLKDERKRLAAIHKIVNWKNPGPGGYYDDLGNLSNQPHLIKNTKYKDDPSFLHSTFVGSQIGSGHTRDWHIDWMEHLRTWRMSWLRYEQTLHGTSLKMHYTDLDSTAQYVVKVTYSGDHFKTAKTRLIADGDIQVHNYMKKPFPPHPVMFDIPKKATKDGNLTLSWNQLPGVGGNGRGCQIAEVWIMKKQYVEWEENRSKRKDHLDELVK